MDLEKEVFEIALADIVPNRFQPREKFDDDNLEELATSIKEHGVIQPIIVRKVGDKYEIVAGERRFRASSLAGKTTIPSLIRNIDDKESAKIALLENLQRKNLTAIEEARTYQTILKLDNLTQEELAANLGKSQSTVANKLRLLNLIPEIQDALLHEKISERHARSLLVVSDPVKQKDLLDRIILQRLTVKQLDDIIALETGNKVEEIKEEINEPKLDNFINNFIDNPEIQEALDKPIVEQKRNDYIDPTTLGPTISEEAKKAEQVLPKEEVLETPIVEQELKPKPVNRHIFDGLRRDEEYEQYIPRKVIEEELPEDRYKDILEKTEVPSPTEIVHAPKEDNPPIPKYLGPKYDYPNMSVEHPAKEEPIYSSYSQVQSILNDNNINTNTNKDFVSPIENQNSNPPAVESKPQEIIEEPIYSSYSHDQSILNDNNINTNTNTNKDLVLPIENQDLNQPVAESKPQEIIEKPIKQENSNDIYDMRFAINNFRQAIQNTEKFGFKIDVQEFDFDNIYQIVIKIDKK